MPMRMKEAREALERRKPRMPLAQVQQWATSYAFDDAVIDAVAPTVRARGHFLRDEFLTTYRWKTHRTLHHAQKYSDAEVADVTGVAFRQDNEKLRICLLRAMDGVNWPVASTLLHVGMDPSYPILDFRALWSLGSGEPSGPVSFEFWWAYVECCRALAEQAGVSVRELDKALWAYSEANQPRGTR
jgi:hypothetical protein